MSCQHDIEAGNLLGFWRNLAAMYCWSRGGRWDEKTAKCDNSVACKGFTCLEEASEGH